MHLPEIVVLDSNFYVYRYVNKLDGKMYFGKGQKKRAWWHLSEAASVRPSASYLIKAIRYHGCQNFEVTIMMDKLTEVEALRVETFYVRKFKTNICRWGDMWGYNQTDGGEGSSGKPHSAKTRAKLVEWKKLFPESPSKGKVWSIEAKKRHSLKLLGRKIENPKITFLLHNMQTVRFLFGLGLSKTDVAYMFDVSVPTIYRHLKLSC